MLWHAMPPELNTARLMAGAGPAPMMQAAAGWEALATALETQADELAVILTSLSAAWTGASGERAITATTPMVAWLRTVAVQAQQRALQAAAQAAAYTTALAMTPSLPEIAANHITHAVLVATNFLGINTAPIGLNEADYFVRMWNQAAGAMDIYQAETVANTFFEPLPPMKPIVLPDAGAAATAATTATVAELAAKAADLHALAALASDTVTAPVTPVDPYERLMPFLSQMGQLSGPMQQLSQLLQSAGNAGGLSSGLGDDRDRDKPQMGLLGAGPLSSHPLAGGAGPSGGAGLLRADALPGAGGSPPRTPMLSQILDKPSPSVAPAGATAATGAGAGTSAVGSGAAPLAGGMGAHGAAGSATRSAMAMPAVLTSERDESNHDEYDDEDDW